MEEVANLEMLKKFFEKKDVDGGLIGGASLKAQDFEKIIESI